jgi:hypothetical protein
VVGCLMKYDKYSVLKDNLKIIDNIFFTTNNRALGRFTWRLWCSWTLHEGLFTKVHCATYALAWHANATTALQFLSFKSAVLSVFEMTSCVQFSELLKLSGCLSNQSVGSMV